MLFKELKADISDVYKVTDNVELPLKIFLPKTQNKTKKSVLLIHGGGWTKAITNNSEWDGGWLCNNAKYLAKNGFISIVISYRSLNLSPKLTVLDLLQDCIDAIEYIQKKFDFVSFDDITYIGESAGGYFATMLGLSKEDKLRPKKVVVANPVIDRLSDDWKYGFTNIENINRITPINCIGEKAAEFLFLHGTEDKVVKVEDTEKLHHALIRLGHKSKLIKLPNEQHAFMLYEYRNSDEYISKIMDIIIDFVNFEKGDNLC